MQHLKNLKDKAMIKKETHKLSKEEYKDEVFKEKAKITCQFILLTIASMIFAGLFYTWLNLSHEPQVKAEVAKATAKVAKAAHDIKAAATSTSTDPTTTSTTTLFGLVWEIKEFENDYTLEDVRG